MIKYNENSEINKLTGYIESMQSSFTKCPNRTPYSHMGATLTDSILQAGLNYRTVVFPRVYRLLTDYSLYKSTCDFIILFKTIPLKELLNWNNEEKLNRLEKLSFFLFDENVHNENDLIEWFKSERNVEKMSKIKGIGPKTIDYLKLLIGIPSIPIDRHLFKFLEHAGIKTNNYEYASYIFSKASQILNINKQDLDYNVWTFMSSNSSSNKAKTSNFEQISIMI